MDPKLLFSLASAIVGIASFYPYLRDTLKGNTRPHVYTWVIWTVTQGIATAGVTHGSGGYAVINLGMATLLVGMVALVSVRYGTRNITKSDTTMLVGAGAALLAWAQLNDPLLAVRLATLIDVIGYVPTYRKTWQEPSTETPITWFGFVIATIFALLAVAEYNQMTTTYLVAMLFANSLTFLLAIRRSRIVCSK